MSDSIDEASEADERPQKRLRIGGEILPGETRVEPCANCIGASLSGNGDGICYSVATAGVRSNRCFRCYSTKHKCVAANPLVFPLARRLTKAIVDDHKAYVDKCRVAIRLILNLVEEENSVFEGLVLIRPPTEPQTHEEKLIRARELTLELQKLLE